jgi:CBS domain-containing protein
LVEKDIYSVPVYDSSQQKKYLGLFDLVDMIAEMVHMIMSHGNAKTVEELQTVVSSKLKKEVPGVIETLFSERVIDAMDKSGQNPFRPLPEGTPLSEVIEHLTTETRRIPILSEDGKIVQMVSQSDIVRYIHSTPTHMQSLRDKLSQPILAVTRKAVSVCPTVRVVDCFATMIEARVSALPVVDDDVNALVGVVTLKDISGIFEDNKQLFTPIEDYIAWMRQKNTGTLREFPFISMVRRRRLVGLV